MWVAGPGAGGLLADWGADVIKVETPVGDPMRRLFQLLAGHGQTESPPFDLDNRGKRSVVVDLAVPEGVEIVRRLLRDADVFLTNLRPEAVERLGLGPDDLLAEFPRLVYASVSGYGLEGPEVGRAGYDVGAFWARSGIAVADGARRHRPARHAIGHGRPRHRHHHGGRHPRRAARPRAHRPGPARGGLPAAHRHLHRGMGPRHPDAVRQARIDPAPHHRDEPDVQLLRRRATGAGSGCSGSRPTACGPSSARPSIGPDLLTDERFSTARGRRHERGRARSSCSTRSSPGRPVTS